MRLYLDSVGCRLNQAEIEELGRQFRMAGHALVGEPSKAEIMVLNTCAVTTKAAADSRWRVRHAHRSNPSLRIVLTGCWGTLEVNQAAALPGVWRVIPNPDKMRLAQDVLAASLDLPPSPAEAQHPLAGVRGRTRAHIGIQEGCDQHCTFCLTRVARGPLRSEPVEHVIERVQRVVEAGAREAVFTGVQLGAYGRDLPGSVDLATLLKEVLERTELPRLRLSSLEPWDVTGDLLALWRDTRICRHLHLPLQSGSAATLRRMARPIDPQHFQALVSRLRAAIPGLAITTDLMVGFPGESEAEFQESLEFVEEIGFTGAHVFTFSARPGTAAARLPGHVPGSVMKERSQRVRQVIARSSRAYCNTIIGSTLAVLWESAVPREDGEWEHIGHADNYLWVGASARQNLRNQVSAVRAEYLAGRGLRGCILSSG